ncbi:MAG: 2-C-methyl-D-erythritol 2,4-cyclodiphosphate synthase [bacterium]|nr:2-C-methyl-D-erythritol 2,4-cyclodiphosphate synthase [bacterium]
MRIGFGYDVHRLISGRRLIIGGVDIPFAQGLQGNSDADVLSHAIGDALLGAAALGDLGAHFPPVDEQYRNISSLVLLEKINGLLTRSSLVIQNIDATVVAQKPKMMPFINEMRKNIARSLTVEIDQISIKATTTEGLGFAGEGAGIAAYAVCLIL